MFFLCRPQLKEGNGSRYFDYRAYEQQEMKYDSTGMFHWCPPRLIEDIVMVQLWSQAVRKRLSDMICFNTGPTPSGHDHTEQPCCGMPVCRQGQSIDGVEKFHYAIKSVEFSLP